MAQTSIKDFGIGGGAGGNVGDYIISSATTPPDGYIEAGKVYNQSAYPDLYNCIGIVHNSVVVPATSCYGGCITGQFGVTFTSGTECWCVGRNCFYNCGSPWCNSAYFSCTNRMIKLYFICSECNSCEITVPGVASVNFNCIPSCPQNSLCPVFVGNRLNATHHLYWASGGGCACQLYGSWDGNNMTGAMHFVSDGKCRAIAMFGSLVAVCGNCNLCEVKYLFTNDGGVTVNMCTTITSMQCWAGAGGAHCNCQFQAQQPITFYDPKSDKFFAIPTVGCNTGLIGPTIFGTDDFVSWTATPLTFYAGSLQTTSNYYCNCNLFGQSVSPTCFINNEQIRSYYDPETDCTYIYYARWADSNYWSFDGATCTLCWLCSPGNFLKMDQNYFYNVCEEGGCGTHVYIRRRHTSGIPGGVCMPYYIRGYCSGTTPCSIYQQSLYPIWLTNEICCGGRKYVSGTWIKHGNAYAETIFGGPSCLTSSFAITCNNLAVSIGDPNSGRICSNANYTICWRCLTNYDTSSQFFVPIPKDSEAQIGLNDCSVAFKYYVKT